MTISGRLRDESTPLRRSANGCLCCGSHDIFRETTVISSFLALRALGAAPETTGIVFCRRCGFRFYERGLSETEAARYYQGYRDENYYRTRNQHEAFYTRRAHDQIASWLGSDQRRQALASALAVSNAPRQFQSVLDFGGGDGSLIQDVPGTIRAVFDLAGAPVIEGMQVVGERELRQQDWELIVCAQTLEHVNDPLELLSRMFELMSPQSWIYLEVPNEIWSNRSFPGPMRDRWLRWLVRHPRALSLADMLSTGCRILLGFLPPFGFIPMREHLQYFTEDALCALVERSGMHLASFGTNRAGQIYAIATKRSAVVDQPPK